MSRGKNKLINQESKEDYSDKAVEVATSLFQGEKHFDGAEDEFEQARAEESVFNVVHAEESVARARLQRAGNMAGCATGTANEPEEE